MYNFYKYFLASVVGASHYRHAKLVTNEYATKYDCINKKEWKKAFLRFLCYQPEEEEVVTAFYSMPLKPLKMVEFDTDLPIVISIQKNEKYRVTKFLEHYRKIGLTQFVFIDNNSDDGSKEYLLEQENVSVFLAEDEYKTNRREAWINRVIDQYGFYRWYIIADIDELISFTGIEQKSVIDLIKQCERRRIKRIRGMLVDMYPEKYTRTEQIDPYAEYIYFDTDTYVEEKYWKFRVVRGGFRKRIYNSNALLTKYPIVYMEPGDVQGKSHFLFPYHKNWKSECIIAILHYKFLPNDIDKYRSIAQNGSYFNGSAQYKEYIKVIDNQSRIRDSLLSDNSHKLETSDDLKKIKYIIDCNK